MTPISPRVSLSVAANQPPVHRSLPWVFPRTTVYFFHRRSVEASKVRREGESQNHFKFPKNSVELYAEKVNNRGLCAIVQAESLCYKLLGGLAIQRRLVRLWLEMEMKTIMIILRMNGHWVDNEVISFGILVYFVVVGSKDMLL